MTLPKPTCPLLSRQILDLLFKLKGVIDLDGGLRLGVTAVTEAYTVLETDRIIVASSTGGAFTITLPPVANVPGMLLTVIKDDAAANAVTLDGNGAEIIDGSATVATIDAQYDTITVYCDGTEWFIIYQKLAA